MAYTTIQEDMLPEQILKAALQLYQQYGIRKVTMDDVSRMIGKTRTTLYYYYKNKEELFEAVMDMLVKEITDEIAAAMNEAASLREKIAAFCSAKIKTAGERKAVLTALENGMDPNEISGHSKAMLEIHKRLMKRESALLKKSISFSMNNGEIRQLKPRETDMLVFIILTGIRGIKREMNYDNDFSKLNYAINTLADMAVCWLAS
jgi:AcrR family transcriptional regulator